MATGRFKAGLRVVFELWGEVLDASSTFKVSVDLIASVIAHESQAKERKRGGMVLSLVMGAGSLALGDPKDTAEWMEAKLRGDKASIGVAQMQVGLARRLRTKYPLRSHDGVVADLLDASVAVRYVAAALRELRDNLDSLMKTKGVRLSEDELKDLTVLGYNVGWEALRDRNLLAADMGADIPARVAKIRGQSTYIVATLGQWREMARSR